MISVNNDSTALFAQSAMERVREQREANMERLASGQLINSAKDDPAGLAQAIKLATELSSGEQGYRNLNDARSMAEIGENAAGQVSDSLQRMRELAVQGANGTLNPSDRATLQDEMSQLQRQIGESVEQGAFNGINPLQQNGTLQFQAGASETVELEGRDVNSELSRLGTGDLDIASAEGASNAISILDQSIAFMSDVRGNFGATMNRIDTASNNIQESNINTAAARSRIMDTDYAQQTAELSRNTMLEDAGRAMLGQANASAAAVSHLLG